MNADEAVKTVDEILPDLNTSNQANEYECGIERGYEMAKSIVVKCLIDGVLVSPTKLVAPWFLEIARQAQEHTAECLDIGEVPNYDGCQWCIIAKLAGMVVERSAGLSNGTEAITREKGAVK
jgi:hypothetical protein